MLASPFVGVSNDALVLIRAEAQRQPVFRALERPLPGDLAEDDRRLLLAFRQRYERLLQVAAAVAARAPLRADRRRARLRPRRCSPGATGTRRYANLRKLARLARSYEELRGADLEGFVRFVAGQEAVGAKESDAVSEEEGADAVRLLTIHAAKGLEFKVVVVADAGRSRPPVSDILALSDGRFGFKVAHPATGTRVGTESYRDVKEHRDRAEQAERLRLYYVAMTRAMERLIVSGSIGPPGDGSDETPIGWALARLGLEEEARNGDPSVPLELDRGEATVVLRVDRGAARAARRANSGGARPVPVTEAGPARALRGLGRGAAAARTAPARADRPARATASSGHAALLQRPLALRALLLPVLRRARRRDEAGAVGAVGEGAAGLHPTEVGDAVHRALEQVDLAVPTPPESLRDVVRGWYPTVSELELDRVETLVSAYCTSPLASRIAGLGGARVERPFAFELDGVLLNGRLDVLWREGSRALVLDYKTNVLDGRLPGDVVESEYRAQRLVYALACFRAGADEVEIVYQFLDAPDDVVSAVVHPRRRRGARARARGRHRADPRGRFQADPEPVRVLGLPGARSRLRRSGAPHRGLAALRPGARAGRSAERRE